MNAKIILLSVLVICNYLVEVESRCDRTTTRQAKTYIIDLDKAPRDRFKETATDFKVQIQTLIAAEKKALKFDPIFIDIVEIIASRIDDVFPYPFNEELKGIADASGSNLGDVVFANLIYDITAFCTGVVATQANGQIIHGRNLDYGQADYLKNVTYHAQFYRNGSLVFQSAQLAGYVGVLTGHKYKGFTFQINERDQGQWWYNLLAAILDKKSLPLSFVTRDLMENITNFDDAVKKLETQDLIAPLYFILGGVRPQDGVVITRNQIELVDAWRLNASSAGIEKWYLLETNYDHWVPPPPNDDRRTPGMKAMNQTTQANINYDTLLDVMVIEPVCNNSTVYTVIMSAAEDGDDSMRIIIH